MKYFDSFEKEFIDDTSFISLLCYIYDNHSLYNSKYEKYNVKTLLKHLYEYNIDYFKSFVEKLNIQIDDYTKIDDFIIPFIYFEISITLSKEEFESHPFYVVDYGLSFLVCRNYYEFGRYYFHYTDSGYHSYNECFYYLTCINVRCYFSLERYDCLLKKKYIKYKKSIKKLLLHE